MFLGKKDHNFFISFGHFPPRHVFQAAAIVDLVAVVDLAPIADIVAVVDLAPTADVTSNSLFPSILMKSTS